jgi:hypothetical protein
VQRWFERELKRLRKEASPLAFDDLSGWINVTRFEEGQLLGTEQKYGPENLGIRFWIGGEWEAVSELLERQVELAERTDDRLTALNQCVFGGFTKLLIGEYSRAEALFRHGLDNGDRGAVLFLEMRARPWLARL